MKRFDPEKLRVQMALHGFNVSSLSRATGLSQTTISKAARGLTVVHTDTIGKLINGIGCKYEDLFTEDKED